MNEEWRDILGFEGRYQVSNMGRIKSLSRRVNSRVGGRTLKERILVTFFTPAGYESVDLAREKHFLVHRAVALAFIPNPENKPCVNHVDGDKKNNNVSNLEWCTYQENEQHSWKELGKTQPGTCLGKFGWDAPSSKPVEMYTLDGKLVHTFGGAMEAARKLRTMGFPRASQGRVSSAARGETKICYGYVFKYKFPHKGRQVFRKQPGESDESAM